MAPNADSSQLRNRLKLDDDQQSTEVNDEATRPRVDVLKNLRNTEIAIEGVIYDLEGFKHPGGDNIRILGGNDVTVQYKMMHPYHTAKHLEKLRVVGKVTDWKPEYKFDTPFERELKKEVFKVVRMGREFGTPGYFFRAAFYITCMATLEYLWTTQGSSWRLALILGVSQALIGMNVQHDANHGAASRSPWINDLLGFGADFIGGSKWTWWEQHTTHHAYTNHCDKDPDSFSTEPIMNFNDYPLGDKRRYPWMKYQAIYFLPLLSFYWLSSVFNPQILDLRQRGALDMGLVMENDFIVRRRPVAWALRVLYIYLNIVCPIRVSGLNVTTVLQILLMGATSSLTLASLFALSHNFEHVDRDPTKDHRDSGEPVCWFKSQVETSSSYGGFISGYLTGGLNFQIEHHLFPRMSSSWYPYIRPTVEKVCKKHGVRYIHYPWVWQNFIATFKYMNAAGTGSNWMKPLEGKL